MANDPAPVPDAFDFSGGSTGVLLIHGFTGSAAEFRPMGEFLAKQGYTVVGPLLPGHGTTWQDMARCKWQDWANAVEQAYGHLASRCKKVFVGGGSMGGLLTLHLAARHAASAEIAGIILMAPALFSADWRAACGCRTTQLGVTKLGWSLLTVILSVAKNLCAARQRPFATLRVTNRINQIWSHPRAERRAQNRRARPDLSRHARPERQAEKRRLFV